jgi:biotin synthase-like enzyme
MAQVTEKNVQQFEAVLQTAAAAKKAGLDFAAILAMIQVAIQLIPQIKQIIDAIKQLFPKDQPPNPDGSFPVAH